MERSAVFQRKGTTLFLFVDLAQLLEELAENIVYLGTQGSIVFADERRIVRFGRIHRLGEQVIAHGNGLLHHLEDLLLFRRLETDSHIAVENNLLEAVINLLFQNA